MAKNVDISKSGFPNRLRRLREAKNVPVADLAEKAGVTDRTLRDIEAGKRPRVQTATIHSLAKALGVSYTELRYGSRLRRYALPSAVAALVVAAAAVVAYVAGPAERRSDSPPASRPRVTTSSREAYRHFVLGDEAMRTLNREEAKAHYRKALELDSTFAMAAIRLTFPQIWPPRIEARRLVQQAERHSRKVTETERLYVAAQAAYFEGERDSAITKLTRLTEVDPREKDAWALLGAYYTHQRKIASAVSCFEKALEIDSHDATSWNRLAYAREALGDHEGALRASDEYIRAFPYQHNPYDTHGDLLARNGRPDEAIIAFKESLKRSPDFDPSTQCLGCIYMFKRDYGKALGYFRNLTMSKDRGARGRGRFFVAALGAYQGRLDEAMAELNRGLATDRLENDGYDDYRWKLRLKARILSERGEMEEAVTESRSVLEHVLETEPTAISQWLDDHVYILARAGRFEEAGAAVDSCARAVVAAEEHGNCEYWTAKGWLDYFRGDFSAACSAFEMAYELDPLFYRGYPLGIALLKDRRTEEAVRILEKMTMRYKDDRAASPIEAAELYFHLGVAYEETGRFRDAARMYREFLETWKDADPVFDGMKTDARKRLSRVRA